VETPELFYFINPAGLLNLMPSPSLSPPTPAENDYGHPSAHSAWPPLCLLSSATLRSILAERLELAQRRLRQPQPAARILLATLDMRATRLHAGSGGGLGTAGLDARRQLVLAGRRARGRGVLGRLAETLLAGELLLLLGGVGGRAAGAVVEGRRLRVDGVHGVAAVRVLGLVGPAVHLVRVGVRVQGELTVVRLEAVAFGAGDEELGIQVSNRGEIGRATNRRGLQRGIS
jgi:hypothetical protein